MPASESTGSTHFRWLRKQGGGTRVQDRGARLNCGCHTTGLPPSSANYVGIRRGRRRGSPTALSKLVASNHSCAREPGPLFRLDHQRHGRIPRAYQADSSSRGIPHDAQDAQALEPEPPETRRVLQEDLCPPAHGRGPGLSADELGPGGTYPPVLPVVIYNGERNWNAATKLRDLFAPVPGAMLGYLPRYRYLLIDLRALDPSLLAAENVVSLMAMLEQARSQGRLEELGAALADWLVRVGESELLGSFEAWITQVLVERTDPAGNAGTEDPEQGEWTDVNAGRAGEEVGRRVESAMVGKGA